MEFNVCITNNWWIYGGKNPGMYLRGVWRHTLYFSMDDIYSSSGRWNSGRLDRFFKLSNSRFCNERNWAITSNLTYAKWAIGADPDTLMILIMHVIMYFINYHLCNLFIFFHFSFPWPCSLKSGGVRVLIPRNFGDVEMFNCCISVETRIFMERSHL